MKATRSLRQLGPTQQKLLRCLLLAPQGASVEALCQGLGVTHNAVRQHLTALIVAGLVERGSARLTGGRPQAVYLLQPAGRDLFPRHYGLVATSLLEHLYASVGKEGVQAMLASMGRQLGTEAAAREGPNEGEPAATLAAQLDALGYEAQAVRRDGEMQVEVYNCVFHALARAHPDICRFDIAFMEAASGRTVHHMECLLRGGRACRFRLGDHGGRHG